LRLSFRFCSEQIKRRSYLQVDGAEFAREIMMRVSRVEYFAFMCENKTMKSVEIVLRGKKNGGGESN
jgi:hypothetical protein